MADMQPQSQNPPARKSVTINLKPEINSVPVNSTTSRLPPELNPGPPTVETEPANQNKFLSINSNLSQGISFNQIDLNGQMNQYNNSGQGSIQTSQIPGNVQAALSGFYPSHDVPPVEPPIPEHFNSTQPSTQFLRNSNHFCNQPTPQMSQQPLSVDAQPYMLPKALQELSDEKVVEQLAEMEATSETMLDTSLAGTEPAGDSQTQKPLDSSNHIKMLKTKQTVMECVMRKLLRSMKQIQDLDPERRNKTEVEAEHRLKMARMMQLLMLQRKNLQQQVDALTQSHSSLLQKHQCLKTYSEGCVSENLELNKKCRKLQTERDSKEAQIKALMQLSCKLQKKLEGHAHTELALENTTLEVKRLVCDNENLKAANQQLETSYNENVKEREGLTLQNNQLKMDLDRIRTELANQRVRTEKVSAENSSLRNQLSIAEAGSKTAAKKSVEYGQLKEAYENLQFDHQRLQMLYISETETRRELHNQLQEVNGNIRVISRFRPSEECDEDVESPFEFCAMDKIFVCGKSIPISVAYQRQLGYNQPQAYTARDEFFAFNRVFQENANQADIFEEIQPIVGSFQLLLPFESSSPADYRKQIYLFTPKYVRLIWLKMVPKLKITQIYSLTDWPALHFKKDLRVFRASTMSAVTHNRALLKEEAPPQRDAYLWRMMRSNENGNGNAGRLTHFVWISSVTSSVCQIIGQILSSLTLMALEIKSNFSLSKVAAKEAAGFWPLLFKNKRGRKVTSVFRKTGLQRKGSQFLLKEIKFIEDEEDCGAFGEPVAVADGCKDIAVSLESLQALIKYLLVYPVNKSNESFSLH
ncbi:Kinesin-like protein KIFC1 [Echinococcus granulosus]|uniref:Kinesin-like protein KIFC1 n=1 Tax=Echinococcus granulosus TaxID=6210 RepID=W6UG55_ECHGR|nr:Kinesin-like protein KIFC1 [Echinococcus granulosus]EUB59941.1 Kinesin-like protein KIFC1 [Echinococcus granulosus]